MSEISPISPVPIEDELARIGELSGVNSDELAGIRTEPQGFAVDQGVFGQDDHEIVPITEVPQPTEPKYLQESVIPPTDDDIKQGLTLLQRAKDSKEAYAEIIGQLDNLSSAVVRDMITDEIGLLLAPTVNMLGSPDYITYFRNMHAVVAACKCAELRTSLTRAIYEGQREVIVSGSHVVEHNDYHLSIEQVEILSMEIQNDHIREELIVDVMSGRISEDQAADLVKHLGRVFDGDLIMKEWHSHRFTTEKDQGILQKKRKKCLVSTAKPSMFYPKAPDVVSAFESVRNIRQGKLEPALSSLDMVQHPTLQEIVVAHVMKKRSSTIINPNEFSSEFADWFLHIDAMDNRSLASALQAHANQWQVDSLHQALQSKTISWAQAELSSYTIKDDERRETFILGMLSEAKDYDSAVAVCQRHIGNFYDRNTILDALAHLHFEDKVTTDRFVIQQFTRTEAQMTRQRNE